MRIGLKVIRRVSMLLVLLLILLTMLCGGCGNKKPEDSDSDVSEDPGNAVQLVKDGECVFTIVRGDSADSEEVKAASALNKSFESATGLKMKMATDWDDGTDNTARPEILVGNTNRPETAAAKAGLGELDYVIKLTGNKLVICGGSPYVTSNAVSAFVNSYLGEGNEALPADLNIIYKRDENVSAKYMDSSKAYKSVRLSVLTNDSGYDEDYIYKNTAAAISDIRFADGGAEIIYRFDIDGKIQPTVTVNMCHAYTVEVAEIPGKYTQVISQESGAETVAVTIDPYAYKIYDTLYVRLTDPTPEDGGGAAISSFTFAYYEEGEDTENPYYLDGELKSQVEALSAEIPASEAEGYAVHEDGGMIYNPISREKSASLGKYDGADCFTGTLSTDGVTLNYSIPKNITAYDAVPVNYTLTSANGASSSKPVHISATSFEDSGRENGVCYDLNFPGTVDLTFNYEGYVAGTCNEENKPKLTLDFAGDEPAAEYPDFTLTELLRSGTVQLSDYTWFKFTYKNTGNTVLDGDGNGTFCFEPLLYKKSGSNYTQCSGVANLYYRIVDELYPGEEGTLWVIFPYDMEAGEYRVVINGLVRNEIDNPENFGRTIWGGETMTSSTFSFTAANAAADTESLEIVKKTANKVKRNKWLHSYEEFQSSYDSWLSLDKGADVQGTIYLQCAPWTNQVVLKLISGNTELIDAVSLPVQVESDSLSVNFNAENKNYVDNGDGTRSPAIMTQSMADMRINLSQSPYCADDIVRYLAEIHDLGFNIVNTTAGFAYDNGNGGNAFRFSVDVMRKLGLKLEGFVSYPYTSAGITAVAANITGGELEAGGVSTEALALANAILAKYQFLRWGDAYWVNNGATILSVEDTRGGSGITSGSDTAMATRSTLDSTSKSNFIIFCRSLYGTIEKLNKAWGSDYATFYDIDPDADCKNGKKRGVFGGWSRALADLDAYRTLERSYSYQTMIDDVAEVIPGALIDLRSEGSHWMATIDPATTNMHYRHVFYDQRGNAIIPELLGTSGTLYCMSCYIWDAYTPSEVSYMTASSLENGVVSAMLPLFNRMRDVAINPKYGKDYTYQYNLTGEATKGVEINTTVSLYEWWKATYEAGGIPGILWSDYLCDGYATATQRREIAFFVSKLNEAMDSDEGRAWATNFENDTSALGNSKGVYSFDSKFTEDKIAEYYNK